MTPNGSSDGQESCSRPGVYIAWKPVVMKTRKPARNLATSHWLQKKCTDKYNSLITFVDPEPGDHRFGTVKAAFTGYRHTHDSPTGYSVAPASRSVDVGAVVHLWVA